MRVLPGNSSKSEGLFCNFVHQYNNNSRLVEQRKHQRWRLVISSLCVSLWLICRNWKITMMESSSNNSIRNWEKHPKSLECLGICHGVLEENEEMHIKCSSPSQSVCMWDDPPSISSLITPAGSTSQTHLRSFMIFIFSTRDDEL